MKNVILHSLIVLILMASCNDDSAVGSSIEDNSEYRQIEIELTTSFQLSSSDAESEEVVELDLVICKNGIYQYTRQAYSSDYATFRSYLKIDEGVDIYFFANCRYALTDQVLVEGKSWEDIQAELIITSPCTQIDSKIVLPMWGRIKNVNISNNQINRFNAKLLRAVAAANVIFDLTPGKGLSFQPDIVYVYYGADMGFIAPTEDNLVFDANGDLSKVKEPVSPTGMRTNRKFSVDAVNGAFVNSIFLFDNEYETNSGNSDNRRTRLVVGGVLEGTNERTYYPLDFSYSNTNEILKVTRNSMYNLKITSVNTKGWESPDEAVENASVNLEYSVVEWDEYDQNHIGIDGPNYLSISSKYVTVHRKAGAKVEIKVSGTYKKEDIELDFATTHNGNVLLINNGVKNNKFSVEKSGEDTNLTLIVTALSEFSKTNPTQNKDICIVKAGRIRFEIEIEQINSGEWSNGGNQDIDF